MSMTRTGHGPNDWRDDGPASPNRTRRAYASVPAVGISEMRPIIVGTVLSQTHEQGADDAHAKADAKLRQRFSINLDTRW